MRERMCKRWICPSLDDLKQTTVDLNTPTPI